MKLFGLTGGAGMGKSTCAGLLRRRGIPVIDTDDVARDMVRRGQPALHDVVQAFGASLLDEAGELRRQTLAEIVFADPAALKRLEAILHPRITANWLTQVSRWRAEGWPAVVVVIPLLFETQAEAHFSATVCLACTSSTQQNRLAARGWSAGESARRLAAQLPIGDKMARANHVIWTEGSIEAHADQVVRIFGPEPC